MDNTPTEKKKLKINTTYDNWTKEKTDQLAESNASSRTPQTYKGKKVDK